MANAKRKKNLAIEDFPQVFKGHGTVVIVYRDHSETYKLQSKYGKKDAEANNSEYNEYNEVEMLVNNGWRRVHGKKEIHFITP